MLEEEKHWDYICLTILTIATAALAGVFFILGIGSPEETLRGLTGVAIVTTVGLASLLYSMMVARTARALFIPDNFQATESLQRKKYETSEVFALFGTMMAPLLAVVALAIITPVYVAHFTPEEPSGGKGENSGKSKR
jgi:uncharacterized membrane protein